MPDSAVPVRRVLLESRDIARAFPTATGPLPVLRGVSLSVHAGETVALRGESGSGKTTLLNILSGLESADAGTVHWDGDVLPRNPGGAWARPRGRFLGLVFQAYHLVPELDVLANVLLAARIVGRAGRAERDRAVALLGRLGLEARLGALPATLSGGERQRVAVARALLNRPAVVLADEPTGNLDERTGEGVLASLLEVARAEGAALLLVTHNPAHAARCDRILHLRLGVLSASDALGAPA